MFGKWIFQKGLPQTYSVKKIKFWIIYSKVYMLWKKIIKLSQQIKMLDYLKSITVFIALFPRYYLALESSSHYIFGAERANAAGPCILDSRWYITLNGWYIFCSPYIVHSGDLDIERLIYILYAIYSTLGWFRHWTVDIYFVRHI